MQPHNTFIPHDKWLKMQLAKSEETLKQARASSEVLTAQLKASELGLKKEKEALQNVRTSFEAYRKEEEKKIRRLKRERNGSLMIIAGLLGYMVARKYLVARSSGQAIRPSGPGDG